MRLIYFFFSKKSAKNSAKKVSLLIEHKNKINQEINFKNNEEKKAYLNIDTQFIVQDTNIKSFTYEEFHLAKETAIMD